MGKKKEEPKFVFVAPIPGTYKINGKKKTLSPRQEFTAPEDDPVVIQLLKLGYLRRLATVEE